MLPCQWNINQRLARFVNDPKEFRSRLGQADALISGTFALLFFAQLYWLDSGLDIYVQQGLKADALIRYIGEDKSYKFDHSYSWSDNDQHRTLTKVLIFSRIIPPGSPQIRFHLTRTSPLHSILTDCAFSTAHVNIITWNKAYYEAMGQILSKYSAHEWRTSDWADYDQARGCNKPGIRENLRRIGDSSTWIIPLSLYKILQGATTDVASTDCRICATTSATSTCEKDRHRPTAIETYTSITSQSKEQPVRTLLDNYYIMLYRTSSLSFTKVSHRIGSSSVFQVWMLAASRSHRIGIDSLRMSCSNTEIQCPTTLQASTRQICNIASIQQARNITSDNHAAEVASKAEIRTILADTQTSKSVHTSTP
ncbi:hypothetical protein KCU61_g1073, partial [Aureobasidium melanogenum]